MKSLNTEKALKISSDPATPFLPKDELIGFVKKYLSRRKHLLEVLRHHTPPIYILDSYALLERARQFRRAFTSALPNAAFYFAVKSNNHPEVSRRLIQSGFGLDVSSGPELRMALELEAKEIVFSGPGKTEEELERAARNSVCVTVLLDSFGELHRLERIASSFNVRVRAGVRLTTNPNGLWRKFGIPAERLMAFRTVAQACKHIALKGIQFHTSWNLSADAQVDFIHHLGRLFSALPSEVRSQLEFIDIGGGYWPEQGEWLQPAGTPEGMLKKAKGEDVTSPTVHYRFPSEKLDPFAKRIGKAIQDHISPFAELKICLEPGRWISNDAMHLLMTVVDKKAEDLIITDAGTNAIGWERFETDYFPVLNLHRPSLSERACLILGSLCTPHDVWGYSYFGKSICEGDVLMIPCQGAYTYSLRQNFIKPIPEVVIVENNPLG
jgi:diaminopimelate decarboxylase